MSKPFAILEPGDVIESGPFIDPIKGLVWINVRRVDGTLTEEIAGFWDGRPTVHTYTTTVNPDCEIGVGSIADDPDPAAIKYVMNTTRTTGMKSVDEILNRARKT